MNEILTERDLKRESLVNGVVEEVNGGEIRETTED